jgi:CheY-like chemotaxis protein
LGGEIRLVSEPGKGSTFTLYLPQVYTPSWPSRKPALIVADPEASAVAIATPASPPAVDLAKPNGAVAPAARAEVYSPEPEVPPLVNEVGDDRDQLQPGDRVLLIVENDLGFARLLLEAAREKGFKGLVTSLGAAALAMAREYKPAAMTLDIFLPDIDGWRVLDRIKRDLATRHIPVCVISTEEARSRSLDAGALTFIAKPLQTRDAVDELVVRLKDFVDRSMKSLLIVEPDPSECDRILECLGGDDIQVTSVADGKSALQMLRERRIDCMIIDPRLPDLNSTAFAEEAWKEWTGDPLPVLIYAEDDPTDGGHDAWKRLADVFTVRRVHSRERLLDQAGLFLHRNLATLPEGKRRLLEDLHSSNHVLPGKKVLIVDDDMRNIFALSAVLEEYEMVILPADNGRDAIRILRAQPDIDLVLMDIMMPEMDGIDTMREIRKFPELKSLPIIAVTAKAMKGDRERCIEAGAWDYLSKPVDTEQLLAVLRAWLHR